MKERCIDNVAIHHSFVSRNYRKDLSSCAIIFCFSKFDIAHNLVQALISDTAEKRVRMLRFSSHLSVQGYDSSSANISWRGFFRRDNKLFSPRGLPTEEAMTSKGYTLQLIVWLLQLVLCFFALVLFLSLRKYREDSSRLSTNCLTRFPQNISILKAIFMKGPLFQTSILWSTNVWKSSHCQKWWLVIGRSEYCR